MADYEDLEIDLGKDAIFDIYITDGNGAPQVMTGITPEMKMALNYTDSDKIDWTSSIKGNDSDGIINVQLSNTVSATVDYRRKYVYDVSLTYVDSDLVTRKEKVLEGLISVNPSIT